MPAPLNSAELEKLTAAVQKWAEGKATLKEVRGYTDEELYAVARTAHAFFHQGKVAEARTIFQGLFAVSPRDAWVWLVVDFVIFAGLANGVILWAAAFRVAQARWTGAVNRLGHSVILFTPILFLVLIALLTGVKHYAVWVEHPIFPG